ncbi:lytic murein transglycosylase [Xanthobacter dioxanivorans]|uniref:Lytic murein transglycosylase n=1 Tax=Xanthobacter dioxanivorans TaxID=2528964 RepID=A0A974PTB2_9HYPH|nr:lytic murein transglycosylase [Xanthobacter dioxanivorans]QRG09166.1 lytic murein transglycosylase [Xanthobacter dioxanivorans]
MASRTLRSGVRAALALAAAVLVTPAAAQAQTTGSIFPFLQPPAQQPAAAGGGHPLMQPEALAQAQANFPNCIAALWPLAQSKGVSRRTFERYTARLEPQMKIMDFMDSQPEFSKPIGAYVNMLVTDWRIKKGREILERYKPIFEKVEKAYGVDRYAVAAIWGIESTYGDPDGIGRRNVLESVATLACIGRRQEYFRDEFIATLQILEKDDVPYDHMKGSWAGAFGPTQFMPTSFQRFAVDFDGDGKRNVVDSIPDIIASTANNLKLDGWEFGKAWGYEVVLPQGFDYRSANRTIKKSLAEWNAMGVRRTGGIAYPRPGESAYLLLPAGSGGPAFLMMKNFDAILRYNPADAYALAIGHLADRLRGGGAFAQSWPKEERGLSKAERLEIQGRLAQMGYDIGNVDGILGQKTRVAIQDFQARSGMVPDGYPDLQVLAQMRR